MKRKFAFLFFLVAGSLLIGCDHAAIKVQRARDPWIFRVNLDHMPRIVVLALNDELWAAYDVQHARLYKLWKGGINFNGPMYDDRHNVQPSTRGKAYAVDTIMDSPWRLAENGAITEVTPKYTGYSAHGDKAILHYHLRTKSGHTIKIDETPEYTIDQDGRPGFTTSFETSGVPAGLALALKSIVQGKERAGKLDSMVNIKANGKTTIAAHFTPQSVSPGQVEVVPPEEMVGPVIQKEETVTSAGKGAKLISLNDCSACHTVDKKAIGPSFKMVAGAYEATDEVIDRLAGKIISGGSGVWGRQAMTPHPNLSKEDAVSMVKYMLSLKGNSSIKKQAGIVADFYKSSIPLIHNPVLIAGQLPNLSTVVPDLEFTGTDMSINRITKDFFGFEDQFTMNLSGYLSAPSPGTYVFELKANAGARFYLDDKKIEEVDYENYDYQSKKFKAALQKGPNPFRVEYYEDIYSSLISLRWKPPGQKDFSVIPASAFTHDPGEIKKTAPGLKEIYQQTTPGFGASLVGVNPAFDVTTVKPKSFNRRISALKFMPDGKLIVSTWDSTGSIYILDGVQGTDIEHVKVHLFATGLYEVMGLEYVDGKIYALQKWELTELNDHDGDGVADEYLAASAGWSASANFHEWAFGLLYRDGYFYLNTSIALGGNGVLTDSGIVHKKRVQTKDRGKTLKIRKSDWSIEALAHGYKAPNGIGFGIDNEIFTTDNEGHMVPTNKMMHVPHHGYPFFGNDEVLRQLSMPVPKMKPPVLWMPEWEVSNSPSQPILFKMGPYQDNQMVVGDVHHGGLNRMFLEKVHGDYQGAIFPFTQGLEAGITRISYGPDSNLYMAGLGAGGDFGHMGQCCGLQRLSFNGKPVLDMLAVRAKSNGMEIEFTEPLKKGEGANKSEYAVQQFWYETGEDVPEGGVKNDIENLPIRSVSVSSGGRKVFLEISGMKKAHVLYIKIKKPFVSSTGVKLWTGDAWYTLNNIPSIAFDPKSFGTQ